MRTAHIYFRTIIFCTLLIFSLAGALSSGLLAAPAEDMPILAITDVNDVFDASNEKYKAGNFGDALKLYESLLSNKGIRTADIYYNIGNAQFKLQNYGKAIVWYRRALVLAPRSQDIIANLDYVRGMTTDRIDQTRSAELLPEIFFFHYSLSKPETEAVFMCVYIALALLGITHFFHKSKTIRWLVSVALVLTLGFGGSTIMKLYRPVNHNQAVVVADEAEIHTGPGRNYMISFSLHDGAELRVRKKEKGWYQIELPDGRRGWLNVSHIEGV